MDSDLSILPNYVRFLEFFSGSFRAPAKINLFLEILGKRPDGYHELSTVMHTIDLCDVLTFKRVPAEQGIQLTCSDPSLPLDETNLVLKAAFALRPYFPQSVGLQIHLEKNIPHGAGLGGGSSDAATTLLALNHILRLQKNREQLSALAETLGSDVPFFLYGGTAHCLGRGEQVMPLFLKERLSLVLTAYSHLAISTAKVYKNLTLPLTLSSKTVTINVASLSTLLGNKDLFFNHLEQPAFLLYPELTAIKKVLVENFSPKTLLSGSGAFFFSVHNSLGEQEKHYSTLLSDPAFRVIKACSFL